MDNAIWLFCFREGMTLMELNVHTSQRDYPILIEHGLLARAGTHVPQR